MTGYVDPTREDFARFREMQREGPIHMLNLLRFRDVADYDDGTVATGAEAYRNYAKESGPIFGREIAGFQKQLRDLGVTL